MEILEKMRELATTDYNTYLEEAKNSGKKIIGYFCSYFPEEIVHAAGFIPYRMRAVGSSSTAKGDVFYSSLNCTFVRHCFDKALQGDFHFLDGIVFLNGCDHTRRMYDLWRHADLPPDFRYMFVVPHKIGKLPEKRFIYEVNLFKQIFEKQFDVKIADEALLESIKLYNKKRKLLSELYAMREQQIVPIKGSEVLSVLLAITCVPVETAVHLLETLLHEIKDRNVGSENDLRLFLASGCIEELSHLELIENCGGLIVADSICLGSRYVEDVTDESTDPVKAIVGCYLNHQSCPRMMNDYKRRLDKLHTTKKRASIDAIIAEKLKFCDLWGGELYLYRKESKKHGYPILLLERELYGQGEGQIKTRVQAFFEQVHNQKTTSSDIVTAAGENYRAVI